MREIVEQEALIYILQNIDENSCKDLCEQLKKRHDFKHDLKEILPQLQNNKKEIVIEAFQVEILDKCKNVKGLVDLIKDFDLETLKVLQATLQGRIKTEDVFWQDAFSAAYKNIQKKNQKVYLRFLTYLFHR